MTLPKRRPNFSLTFDELKSEWALQGILEGCAYRLYEEDQEKVIEKWRIIVDTNRNSELLEPEYT